MAFQMIGTRLWNPQHLPGLTNGSVPANRPEASRHGGYSLTDMKATEELLILPDLLIH